MTKQLQCSPLFTPISHPTKSRLSTSLRSTSPGLYHWSRNGQDKGSHQSNSWKAWSQLGYLAGIPPQNQTPHWPPYRRPPISWIPPHLRCFHAYGTMRWFWEKYIHQRRPRCHCENGHWPYGSGICRKWLTWPHLRPQKQDPRPYWPTRRGYKKENMTNKHKKALTPRVSTTDSQ